jgi:hypothetical protein
MLPPAQFLELVKTFFSVNSVGSILLRAAIWFVVALVIIASTDTGGSKYGPRNIRANLGFLLLFLVLGSGLVYLLFGFVPLA